MLVLSRERLQEIIINNNIVVSVQDIRGDKVRLGITAPLEVPVHRREVFEAIQKEHAANLASALEASRERLAGGGE